MGEILDSISHQWRQPLMHINAVLMNLDREVAQLQHASPKIVERITEVSTLTTHMSDAIEDLRRLFTPSTEPELFDPNDIVHKAMEIYRPSLEGIHVDYLGEGSYRDKSYLNELSQSFLILLGNAIEALNHKNINNKQIWITLKKQAEKTVLSIEDNAGGIAPDLIPHFFDPYFSTKGRHNNAGLGLYIAKILIHEHAGGTLTVANGSHGVIFTIQYRSLT